MIRQSIQILRLLLDRRVTATPQRVLRQLQRRNILRLPGEVRQSLMGVVPGLTGWRFVRQWLASEHITRHNGQWVINSFLPPFPGQAYDRMFENLLSGRRLSPVSAFLAVTETCPYRCWHCSFKQRAGGHLTGPEWRRIIEQLHSLGASIIGFTGGEPCVRKDLPELVAAASGGGATTLLFSSGANLDRPLLQRLRRAGLWSVCLSLDHPEAEQHDRLRGAPGAHARACQALEWARAEGFYTMMGTVVTAALIEQNLLPRLHRLARARGVQEWRLVEPMPCGLLAQNPEARLTAAQIQTLREFHQAANRRRVPPKVCAFNQIESPELFGCGAGTQHLFIDAKGEVCPCDFTAMSFGNAAREPLAQIWARMTDAMGNPRRHCFIQRHHALLWKHGGGEYPLSPEQSLAVCAETGREPLPDFFQLLAGRKE